MSQRGRHRQETEGGSLRQKEEEEEEEKDGGFRAEVMEERPGAGGRGGGLSLQDVLRGQTDGAQRTRTSSNMIRVFISSTFTGQIDSSSQDSPHIMKLD